MISIRASGHYFDIGLVCQNRFVRSLLVSAFYATFYFVKGAMKTEHDTLGFLNSFSFCWSVTYNCRSKQIITVILTDSVIVKIIHIIRAAFDTKPQHCNWNVVKLSTVPAVRRCSSKFVLVKISQYLQGNTCAGVSF